MESLQTQVSILNHKIDGLYEVIEKLNNKVSQAVSEQATETDSQISENGYIRQYRYSSPSALQASLEHKDVLVDANRIVRNAQGSEHELTPEIQIQRLTAQLTAAYNRIAALEEQLLRERIH